MWHQDYLVKNAAARMELAKQAGSIFQLPGQIVQGMKGLWQGAKAVGEAGMDAAGQAGKALMPAKNLSVLDKLKADQAARLANKVPPKPPLG